MDDADRASEREEQLKAQALAHREPEGPKATGYCLACGNCLLKTNEVYQGVKISPETTRFRRWCDAQCRDDWERRQG